MRHTKAFKVLQGQLDQLEEDRKILSDKRVALLKKTKVICAGCNAKHIISNLDFIETYQWNRGSTYEDGYWYRDTSSVFTVCPSCMCSLDVSPLIMDRSYFRDLVSYLVEDSHHRKNKFEVMGTKLRVEYNTLEELTNRKKTL